MLVVLACFHATAKAVPLHSGSVTGATAAKPIVITSTAHGLTTGATVKVTGVLGLTVANGTWTVTVNDANRFSLNDSSGIGRDPYTSGGMWTELPDALTALVVTKTADTGKCTDRQGNALPRTSVVSRARNAPRATSVPSSARI